jgi:hypothetical protein
MTRSIPFLAFAGAALALSACDNARPLAPDGGGLSGCTGCHGDATREADSLVRAAPPASVLGGGDGGATAGPSLEPGTPRRGSARA